MWRNMVTLSAKPPLQAKSLDWAESPGYHSGCCWIPVCLAHATSCLQTPSLIHWWGRHQKVCPGIFKYFLKLNKSVWKEEKKRQIRQTAAPSVISCKSWQSFVAVSAYLFNTLSCMAFCEQPGSLHSSPGRSCVSPWSPHAHAKLDTTTIRAQVVHVAMAASAFYKRVSLCILTASRRTCGKETGVYGQQLFRSVFQAIYP